MTASCDTIAVVLVDDEENILRALQRLLMDEELDVHTAGSGQEGLELLRQVSNVGLIVSDQRMPGMDGAEFLCRSREIVPDALRILLTGYSDIDATIEAINKGGAYRYISKPWDDGELVGTIRDAVAQYTREMEKRRLNEIIEQQNKELEVWNQSLKKRLLQTTTTIREQSEALKNLDEKHPVAILNSAFDNFFEVMGDRYAVHARTVSTLVTDVSRKMGLDAETVARFRLAALLHDAGKLGSLAVTLNKHVDEMSESELSEYRLHPLRGEEMFCQLEELKQVAPLIRSHHESFDGNGFPDGLLGEDIPLGARLIAIADLIEKSARLVGQRRADYALMNARFHGGTLLDPQLVNLFQGISRIVYLEWKKTGEVSDVEVGPMELVPGMLLARDVESAAGVLLLQREVVLDSAAVAVIRSHYHKNPPPQGIFIKVSDE
ncbi:MAG TPA: HD domain-containing phosphohydrolase [Desulfuromonadaceae bacterium]|jgi:response regulator RpfG family c-di-GMP phosphodiesterase